MNKEDYEFRDIYMKKNVSNGFLNYILHLRNTVLQSYIKMISLY